MKKLFNNDTFSSGKLGSGSSSFNTYSHNKNSMGGSMWKFPDNDSQSIATTNTENFEMMDNFSKDVNVQNRQTLLQNKNMTSNELQQSKQRDQSQDNLAAQVIYNSRRAMIGRKESQIRSASNVNPNSNPDHPINLGYEATMNMLSMSKDLKKKKLDKQS